MTKTFHGKKIDYIWGCGRVCRKIPLATASKYIHIIAHIIFLQHTVGSAEIILSGRQLPEYSGHPWL